MTQREDKRLYPKNYDGQNGKRRKTRLNNKNGAAVVRHASNEPVVQQTYVEYYKERVYSWFSLSYFI